MAGINSTLEIAKNTLLNTQIQIQTASHNIANADSKTYSRQKAYLTTNAPIQHRSGWIGNGAGVDRIIQQRDQLIERRLLGATSLKAYYDEQVSHLSLAGAYLSDDGELGFSQTLGEFWEAWDALNNNPQGLSEKAIVTQSANDLASAVRSAHGNLEDYAGGVEKSIKDNVDQANDLLKNIAEYNKEIKRVELQGQMPANDLRDMRYQALTKLSELAPVDFVEEADGTLTVYLNDLSEDFELVSGNVCGRLSYDGNTHLVSYLDCQDAPYPASSAIEGGKIQGGLEVYQSISEYAGKLDTFAVTLMSQVNAAHGSAVFSGTGAGDLEVDSAFDPDGAAALEIAKLQEQSLIDLGGVSFSQYLSGIQQAIGSDRRSAASKAEFQTALHDQLEAQQQSVSGVSIDEETVDLLKFQQIYQAAAKIIQKSAEMLDTVINMV